MSGMALMQECKLRKIAGMRGKKEEGREKRYGSCLNREGDIDGGRAAIIVG
jgi:hypothetical protein